MPSRIRRLLLVPGLGGAALALGSCGKKKAPPPEQPPKPPEEIAMDRLVEICGAVRAYVSMKGEAPASLRLLVEEDWLRGEALTDPWDKPFIMDLNDQGELEFYSDGPDGLPETDDDIEHFCQ